MRTGDDEPVYNPHLIYKDMGISQPIFSQFDTIRDDVFAMLDTIKDVVLPSAQDLRATFTGGRGQDDIY